MTIADNVAVRKEADEAFVFVREIAKAMSPDRAAKFLAVVQLRIAKHLGLVDNSKPTPDRMDTKQAKAFERTAVTFGKYSGQHVGDVPLDYWDYILDDKFRADLRRYTRSNHAQRRADDE